MCVLPLSHLLGVPDVRAISVPCVDGLAENEHLLLTSLSRVSDLVHSALNAKLSWIKSSLLVAAKVVI